MFYECHKIITQKLVSDGRHQENVIEVFQRLHGEEKNHNNITRLHGFDYKSSSGDFSRPSSVEKRHCGLMSHIWMKSISK